MATALKVTDSLGAMAKRHEIFENVRTELAKLGEQKDMAPEIPSDSNLKHLTDRCPSWTLDVDSRVSAHQVTNSVWERVGFHGSAACGRRCDYIPSTHEMKLFLNYRRDDTAPYAGRLYDRLVAHFGADQVFMDIDQIEPGEDFVEVINSKVGACDIAIVSIGPNWLCAKDASGNRRLDDSEDFVRTEIVAALERKIRVIPVLVGGARMPRKQDLPEALAPLSRRNAIELSETRFHADVNRLIEAIAKVKEEPLKAAAGASKESPYVNSLGMRFVPVAGTRVLFSIWQTRVKDYKVFVKATNREWPKPSFQQTKEHPAVNVSWEDATAFCEWLTEQEHTAGRISAKQSYRLPSDEEWSAGVGLEKEGGSTPEERNFEVKGVYPWGTKWPPPNGAGNYHPSLKVDDYENTSPAGSFEANRYGIHDLGGNVWEWCQDWYDAEKKYRLLRGASWEAFLPDFLLSSCRYEWQFLPSYRLDYHGFRCVLVMESSR